MHTNRGPLLSLTHTYLLLLPVLRVLKVLPKPLKVRPWDILVRSSGDRWNENKTEGVRAHPFSWLDSTCAGAFGTYLVKLYELQILA